MMVRRPLSIISPARDAAAEYFSSWTLSLSHLLLQPRFYLGWLNLVQELLTPSRCWLAFLGFWLAHGRNRWLLAGLWLGYLAYGLFLPYQMDTHSYYHLMLVPAGGAFDGAAGAAGDAAVCWRNPGLAGSCDRAGLCWCWPSSPGRRWSRSTARITAMSRPTGRRSLPSARRWQDHGPDPGLRLPPDVLRLAQGDLWPNRGEIKLSNLRGSSKEFETTSPSARKARAIS